MELTIGIQNKETTEAGTLIITMNPVNTARWISTPELIQAEIAVQPYGVISVPEYEDLGSTELMCYVTLNYVTYGAGLADLIAGSIGDEITFTATGTGGGGGALASEITKWIEGSGFSLYDSSASFIASSAFYYAYYLESVEFTEVDTVNSSAFYRSPNLKTVSLPNVSSIASGAFYSCSSLETIYMPNVESIGQSAFNYCSKLQDFEASKVWFIGNSAFLGCQSLTSINFPLLRSGNAQMFENCIRLKTAIIGSSQTSLPSGTFSSCYELETISIPGVSSMAQNVFRACSKLSYIDLPKGSYISNYVFMDCINLETVHLGSMVSIYSVNISSSAFYGCVSLKALYIENTSTNAGVLSANAFNNTPLSDSTYLGYFGSIYVPASKVSTYKAATNWSLFADRITAISEATVT